MKEKRTIVAISVEDVRVLREATNAGVMDCKKALEESGGDIEQAKKILREKGLAIAEKRAGRVASQGLVDSYIHAGGRIGAIVEVNCETDFVARTDAFKELAHDVAMQVAATGPAYVAATDIPAGTEGDPKELALLEQAFIKDSGRSIQDLVNDVIAKTGENVRISRFTRFELGQ